MDHVLVVFFFICFFLSTPGVGQSQSVTYQKVKVGHVRAYVVTADLNSDRVALDLYVASHHPSNRSFPHETFHFMVGKTQPTAAINGTYYDTRTFIPVGTLAADGQMFQMGSHGTAVCFDKSNQVGFYKIRDLKNFPWKSYKVVLSTGPTLVQNGHTHVYPSLERFHDPALFRPASRSALGITRNRKLLLVSVRTPIRLRDMAWIMKSLGAEHAIALDGGSSTALYYRGKIVVRPARMMTNIFLIYEQKEARVSKE